MLTFLFFSYFELTLIIKGDTKVFFAGDSAYDDIFKDIHNLFGDIDICILPIGAYSPEFMMAFHT